jgi:hypothetical protein
MRFGFVQLAHLEQDFAYQLMELARFLETLILPHLEENAGQAGLQNKIRAVSRFICSEAIHWSQEPVQLPLDEEAEIIVSVIADGMPFA